MPITPNDYIQLYNPDKDKMAEALLSIKGVERTMTELAAESGVSQPMLSRILRKEYTKPLSFYVLSKLFTSASPECLLLFEDLLKYNGMVSREEAEGVNRVNLVDDDKMLKKQIRGVMTNSLLNLGMPVKKLTASDTREQKESRIFSEYMVCDLAVTLLEHKPYIEWGFLFLPVNKKEEDTEKSFQSFARMIIRKYAILFLEDAWAPERLTDQKFSFVFIDEDYYKAFVEVLSEAKLNSRMSAILVDMQKSKVVSEHVFDSTMYGQEESLFRNHKRSNKEGL